MTRIAHPQPVRQRQKPMSDKAYAKTFKDAPYCEGCGKPNDGTIVGAHLGMVA